MYVVVSLKYWHWEKKSTNAEIVPKWGKPKRLSEVSQDIGKRTRWACGKKSTDGGQASNHRTELPKVMPLKGTHSVCSAVCVYLRLLTVPVYSK